MIGDPAKSIRNAVLVAKNIARDVGPVPGMANGGMPRRIFPIPIQFAKQWVVL